MESQYSNLGWETNQKLKIFMNRFSMKLQALFYQTKTRVTLKRKNKILFENSDHAFRVVMADVTTLDEFINENRIGTIDILKIDVEGFEFEVIKGAYSALEKHIIKIIQFERHINDMRVDNFPTIDKLLVSHGFSMIKQIKHPFGSFYEMVYQKG